MGVEESKGKGNLLDPHTEFETKYSTEFSTLPQFKAIAESLPDLKEFVYAQGPDVYWTKPGELDSFMRYRKAEHDKSPKAWLTMKVKTSDGNNIQRRETNWRVDKTPMKTIEEGVDILGYKFNFRIWKMCHIYKYKDATLVHYTLKDDKDKTAHFMEIEVDEETIGSYTEDEAWEVIKKYEEILAPLGIDWRNRIRKSLFEMYRKEL